MNSKKDETNKTQKCCLMLAVLWRWLFASTKPLSMLMILGFLCALLHFQSLGENLTILFTGIPYAGYLACAHWIATVSEFKYIQLLDRQRFIRKTRSDFQMTCFFFVVQSNTMEILLFYCRCFKVVRCAMQQPISNCSHRRFSFNWEQCYASCR